MKKTLYTFLVWNFLLFVAGLSDIVFYRNLTSVEGMTISWTQPALVSITSFFNIAFNILWDAPAPFREKFLFETGNQAGRHR